MKATQDLLEDEFLRLCQTGNVEAFLLFNDEGIPMASVERSERYDRDSLAVLSVLLKQSAELTEEFNPEAVVEEISLRTANKFRIVSRLFQVHEMRMILIAVVPQHLPYRKITTLAVQKVQQLF